MSDDATAFERDMARSKQKLELEKQQLEIERLRHDFGRDEQVGDAHTSATVKNITRDSGVES